VKEKILELKKLGKNHGEIANILGCSKATVSYHTSEHVRNGFKARRNKNRKKANIELKTQYGGRCAVCGYSKSMSALDFHHKDETTKSGQVSYFIRQFGKERAAEEAKKCILLCSNCHHEVHDGLLKI